MAATKSRDLSAALTGLVLGGSVIFLLMLTIVWLTNRHFEGEKAEHAASAASSSVTHAPPANTPPGTTPGAPLPPPRTP